MLIAIELTSDSDLFFFYNCNITPNYFNKIKAEQELNVDFEGFLEELIKMLNDMISDPQMYLAP